MCLLLRPRKNTARRRFDVRAGFKISATLDIRDGVDANGCLDVRECLDAHECFAIRQALDARDNTSSDVELSQMLYFPHHWRTNSRVLLHQ